MMRRLAERPGLVFGLVFVWKIALLVFTAQPVPANDSFFYDGPVVNYLLHGKYVNPSLALVLPISGNEVFCAYPPLYQLTLLGWMSIFGTSALAAMWLHVVLFGSYMLAVWGILRQLNTPALCASLAGLFLVSITFHDRPDTLAHLLGALAVYSWTRFQRSGEAEARPAKSWPWIAAVLLLLTLCTSLQIGAIYLVWAGLLFWGGGRLKLASFPWPTALVLVGTVIGLIALVRLGFPLLWEGFREHTQVTPSFTGWRWPNAGDVLKVVRTAPAILLVGVLFATLAWRGKICKERLAKSPHALMTITGTTVAFMLISACLVIITANAVHIANYLQPIMVGCFLAAVHNGLGNAKPGKLAFALLIAAAGLVSVRAVGMTTWGAVCRADMGYRESVQLVRRELEGIAPNSAVLLSSAYLYEAAQRSDLRWIHADWPARPANATAPWEGEALLKLKPAKLIVTQFDYYRRYEAVLAFLQTQSDLVEIKVRNNAKTPSPDSIKPVQRVLQHISWAPVVVELEWR
jgi:hypothetical protein